MTKAMNKTAETFGTSFAFGPEAFQAGFEKYSALFDTIQESAKDNAEACIETALTAGQGIQAANEQFLAYSKDAAAKSLETTKAIFASKSINEAIAIQTSFAKSAFEAYVGQIKKTRELYGRTAKDSVAPLKTRSEVFMSLIAEYARAV